MKVKNARLIILSANLLFNQSAVAQEDDPFAELDQEIQKISPQGQAQEQAEFEQWKQNYLAEYQQFRTAYFAKIDKIRDKLISTWGEAEVSTESKYVVYDEQSSTKTVLDYENNEIVVSVLHDKDQTVSENKLSEAIEQLAKSDTAGAAPSSPASPLQQLTGSQSPPQAINALVKSALKNAKTESASDKNHFDKVIADEISKIEQQTRQQENQVDIILDVVDSQDAPPTDKAEVTDDEIIKKQKQQIEQEKQARIAKLREQTKKISNNDEQRQELSKKQITTFRIPLADRGDLEKANPFIQQVVKQGKRWELQPSLLLSIIHTESYFNPQAQSHIPAFGLMQIVPRTAGVDVNRFLFDKNEPMAEEYLFSPEHNIETGVAYVHILDAQYLKDIEDPLSRMYCTIAAYNTGSGNVAKTFNPDRSRNIRQAAVIINGMKPEQVFQRLVSQLPYEETRHYLDRVTRRKSIYLAVDKL